MTGEQISLELSKDEALVLFEFLSRFSEQEKLQIEDQAEARVLWDLQASLETRLIEPLKSDYMELLTEARERHRPE
jgi:hypothetical protein